MVPVLERKLNAQGLPRLRVVRLDPGQREVSAAGTPGWISESLNPLSGQRGAVTQAVPLPRALLFRVVLAEGCVVRRDVELASPQVTELRRGDVVAVTGHAWTDAPARRCVPRLRLLDGSGWVSLHLNHSPPANKPIVAFVREAPELSPAAMRLVNDHFWATSAATAGMAGGGGGGAGAGDGDSDAGKAEPAKAAAAASSEAAAGDGAAAAAGVDAALCVVCLESPRGATIVHGETGHIACCLQCARVLKGRGDPCPVCRLPIAAVIKNYYA